MQANLPQLLAKERGNTAFDVEPQAAAIYVQNTAGKSVSPAADNPAVRQLERDTTANNPHSGATGETVVNYQAGATEQRILHLSAADPQRTPTYTVFPRPDYYFDPAYPRCDASTTPTADSVAVASKYA